MGENSVWALACCERQTTNLGAIIHETHSLLERIVALSSFFASHGVFQYCSPGLSDNLNCRRKIKCQWKLDRDFACRRAPEFKGLHANAHAPCSPGLGLLASFATHFRCHTSTTQRLNNLFNPPTRIAKSYLLNGHHHDASDGLTQGASGESTRPGRHGQGRERKAGPRP